MSDEFAAVIERYRRFAADEAPGRSELYADWAWRVVEDPALQEVLSRLPANRRQPPLVFAVCRLLGSGDVDAPTWAAWVLAHAEAVVSESSARSVQTNEPLRCAALLPTLSRVTGPIALLEVGASAGLCLYPDRYSYRYVGVDGGEVRLDPVTGVSDVELVSAVAGERMPQVRHPDIVWRAGIDLAPLDVRDSRDVDWLARLVWPGENGRADRIRAAAAVAASDPPLLFAGDALDLLPEAAALAPAGATLVITTPGVLVHIPRERRSRVIERARDLGRWLTIDDPATHDAWSGEPSDWRGGFAVALDGEIDAAADPLGRWWEWRPGSERPRS